METIAFPAAVLVLLFYNGVDVIGNIHALLEQSTLMHGTSSAHVIFTVLNFAMIEKVMLVNMKLRMTEVFHAAIARYISFFVRIFLLEFEFVISRTVRSLLRNIAETKLIENLGLLILLQGITLQIFYLLFEGFDAIV